jgi:hypothetical protein
VTIGPEGLGEWRRLSSASAITINGASVWYLYNTEFVLLGWGLEEGAVDKVDAGTYLLLHGAPDTTIMLTVKP